jgi:hypothetical protein
VLQVLQTLLVQDTSFLGLDAAAAVPNHFNNMATLCHCLTLLGGLTDHNNNNDNTKLSETAWKYAVQTKETTTTTTTTTTAKVGLQLLDSISQHQQIFLERQYPALFSTTEEKENHERPPFLVTVIQTILQGLEEASSKEDNNQKRIFLHRSLELLIDMLSSVSSCSSSGC